MSASLPTVDDVKHAVLIKLAMLWALLRGNAVARDDVEMALCYALGIRLRERDGGRVNALTDDLLAMVGADVAAFEAAFAEKLNAFLLMRQVCAGKTDPGPAVPRLEAPSAAPPDPRAAVMAHQRDAMCALARLWRDGATLPNVREASLWVLTQCTGLPIAATQEEMADNANAMRGLIGVQEYDAFANGMAEMASELFADSPEQVFAACVLPSAASN